MEQELKPYLCPFCGNDDVYAFCLVVLDDDVYGVRCDKCEACIGGYDTKKEAIQAWNTRTIANIPMVEAWSAIPENVDTAMFWQAQEGDCCCGNHVTRDEHYYCNRCGRKLLWERVKK